MSAEHFFATAVERYNMLLRRQAGESPPWTEDPVLRDFYFCNVFREDDKTTRWLRCVTEKLSENGASSSHVVLAVTAFRWFNYIPTGLLLREMLQHLGWNEDEARRLLSEQQGQLWGGAYIIMPRPGQKVPKLEGVLYCMRHLDATAVAAVATATNSLQVTHQKLMEYPGMGPFMAYEVITDLAHTNVLNAATDANAWANPGPGALRGLRWVYGGQSHTLHSPHTLLHMQELLALSRPDSFHWPEAYPAWDMRTVEHWLCEYDKYRRGQDGQHLKRRYRHGK